MAAGALKRSVKKHTKKKDTGIHVAQYDVNNIIASERKILNHRAGTLSKHIIGCPICSKTEDVVDILKTLAAENY